MLKVLLLAGWLATLGGTVRLRDGKYEEVTVALSPHLDTCRASDLIDSLQTQFEDASSALCKATEGRLSFRSLYVLVPRTWTDEQVNSLNRTNAEGKLSRRRRLSLADIRIENGTINDVQQTKGCGQQGDFITLSADSILKKDKYFGRLLVSLWSRWRFGVFPEANSGFHYHPEKKQFIPNSCTNNHLNWTATQPDSDETCTPDVFNKDLCKVTVADEPNVNITSSLLYKHDLPSMEIFCNSTTHNHFAVTPQNLFCDGKSVMEVLQMSDDFKSTNKNEECQKPEIDVFIVQPNFKRIYVLLALESLSPELTESLTASLLIVVSQLLEAGDEIVVLFNDQEIVSVTVETNKINTMNNITKSLENVKTKQDSACFLSSTYKLFQIINDTDDSLDPFVYVVTNIVNVSKIQDSKVPDLTNLITQLNNIYVKVDTVALHNTTDLDLEQLSRQTGGQSYYVVDSLLQPFLLEPLVNALKDEDNQIETLYHASLSHKVFDGAFFYSNANFSGTRLFINNVKDSTVLYLSFSYEPKHGIKIWIQSYCSPIVDNSILSLCDVSLIPATQFILSVNKQTNPPNQSVNVFAIPNPNNVTLQASAWFSSNSPQVNISKDIFVVYAKVHQGGVPYLDAEVNAKFTTDNGVQFQVSLQDNGVGADLHKNDGIYSVHVSDCSQTGRYSVRVNVISKCYNRMCENSTISFQRNLLVGSVIFSDCKTSDEHKPSFPVRDLTLKDMKDGNATISWTQTSHQPTKMMTLFSLPHWSNEAKNWTASGTELQEINNTVSSFGSTRDASVTLTFGNEKVLFIALIMGEKDDALIASNILTVLPNSSHTEESTTAVPQTSPSEKIPQSTISVSSQDISEPTSGTSDTQPSGGATETVPTNYTSGTTVSSNGSTTTTEDASPISDAVSGSSKSAAAGIIAVVVLVSVGGLIASTYYFIVYKRKGSSWLLLFGGIFELRINNQKTIKTINNIHHDCFFSSPPHD